MLVHLPDRGLRPVLLLAVDLQVLEQRLDVAGDHTVVRGELRIEKETAGRRVEPAIGAEELVQRRDVDLLDAHADVEGRAGFLGFEGRLRRGGAAAHEGPLELRARRALDLLVAEIRQRPVGVGDEDTVRRRRRLVDEADRAPCELELGDPHDEVGGVARLLRRGRGLLAHLAFRAGGRRGMHVVHLDAVDRRARQRDRLHLQAVLDVTVCCEHALVDPEVVPIRDRLEVVELDVGQLDVSAKRRIRLGQEIGLAIRRHAALVEHEGRESNVGRIGTLARAVADVGGDQVEIADVQRLEGALIDVRHVALLNLEVVDLQRIDRLERVLPAAFLDGSRVLDFLPRLRQIDVDGRLHELDVGNELAGQERAPVDARAQPLETDDRRLGMLVLRDHDVVEIEREAQRVEVQLPDARGVALERAIHLRLGIAAQRLVDEERDGVGDDEQDRDRDGDRHPVPPNPVQSCARYRRDLRPGIQHRLLALSLRQQEMCPGRPHLRRGKNARRGETFPVRVTGRAMGDQAERRAEKACNSASGCVFSVA